MNNTTALADAINTDAVLAFFSGKARQNAAAALEALTASLRQGFWGKGVSRSVEAALGKSNVVQKQVRGLGGHIGYALDDARYGHYLHSYLALRYGQFRKVLHIDATGLESDVVVDLYRPYAAAFRPVAEAFEALDAIRPQPVLTTLGASPTVTKTLNGLDATKVEVCPMEFYRLQRLNPKTEKMEWYAVARLLWPAGIRHNTSRFCGEGQCQACGHAIRRQGNWVPLILTASDNTPKSLWVGKDCAETLFGVQLTGDLEIEGR